MGKDSYWFRHDSTAGRGLKLRKIQHIYSHWGKGVYWDVIEILREQDGYKYESDDAGLRTICDLIGCKDESKFITWFNDCVKEGIFEKNDKLFFSPILIENMEKWESSKLNGSKGGRPKKPNLNPINNPTANRTDNPTESIIEEDRREEKKIEEATLFLNEIRGYFIKRGRFDSAESAGRSAARFLEKNNITDGNWSVKADEWLSYEIYPPQQKSRLKEL